MSPEEAIMTKIIFNSYTALNTSFSNMVGDICLQMNDVCYKNVLKSIPKLNWGYGYGGDTLPRDNHLLINLGYEHNTYPYIALATDYTNNYHTQSHIDRLINEEADTLVFKDVSYPENCPVPMIIQSPKLNVAIGAAQGGKKVIIEDTEDTILEIKKKYGNLFEYVISK